MVRTQPCQLGQRQERDVVGNMLLDIVGHTLLLPTCQAATTDRPAENGVTADAKSAADFELQQLQKPEKVWMAILKFVLQYGSAARGLFVGFH